MNLPLRTGIARIVFVACATLASIAAAQTAPTPTSAGPTPASATNPTRKLVDSFSDFAGSPENASALVHGLRSGSSVTLVDAYAPPGPTSPATTTFSPGTKPMGYGNIRIALSLAKAQLASQGINDPTPAEIQGALIGSTAPTGTTTQGVLQMRASGNGLGQIADAMGVKLGAVVSGKRPVTTSAGNATVTRTGGVVNAQGGSMAKGAGNGVVTATGRADAAPGRSGITTAGGGGGHKGITTAAGASGAHAAAGAVNAAGARAGGVAGANSNAGGVGHGRGKP